MKMNVLLASALLFTTPALTMAETTKDDGSTAINMSAEAHRKVAQDSLMATLSLEKEGKTAQEVQQFINEKMKEAKETYDKVAEVKVSNGGYNVYKNYQPDPDPRHPLTVIEREKRATWHASQSLVLDSKEPAKLLKLTGQLQGQGFAVQNLNYYLSREAEDKLKDELTLEALGTIQQRAKAVADKLGMKTIRLAQIDLSGNTEIRGPRAVPMMAMAKVADTAEAAPMPEPSAQGGESDVNVQVTAEVRMK